MASRGTHEFYYVLTSDACMDIYPDNKSSKFNVLLKQPIETEDEEWELSLVNINYPYSWPNIGPAVNSYIKYYSDPITGPVTLEFPDWQCESFDDIIKFLNKQIKEEKSEYKLRFARDPLGRFRVYCESPYYDIGFTVNMMKILGLNSHPDAEKMSIASFDKRQEHRDFVQTYWDEDKISELLTTELKEKIKVCDNMIEFIGLVKDIIDWEMIKLVYDARLTERSPIHKYIDESKGIEGEIMVAASKEAEVLQGDWSEWGHVGQNLEDFMYHMKAMIDNGSMDPHIRATTPGILDPIQRMYIYTNIIEPIDMNDISARLLKLVNTKGEPFKTTQAEFNNLIYIPLIKGKISLIQILITDEFGVPVPFQNGTVVLTLHFRKTRRIK